MATGCFRLPIIKKSSFSEQGDRDYCVRFFDYDGTLLKTQWVYDSEDASEPLVPTHENLTFYGWNKSFTGVTKNLDVGAIYTSTHTYLYLTVNEASGRALTLYLTKSAASNTTIYWGDGTSVTSSTLGMVSFYKNYSANGSYVIRIESVDNFNLGGNSSSYTVFVGFMNSTLTKVILGSKAFLSNYAFFRARELRFFSFGQNITNIPTNCFDSSSKLFHVNLPASCTTINSSGFRVCSAIEQISLPETLTTIQLQAFYYCISLKSIILPSGVTTIQTYLLKQNVLQKAEFQGPLTSIGAYAFQTSINLKSLEFPSTVNYIYDQAFLAMYNIEEFVFNSVTPPTLAATTVFNINSEYQYGVKIYVPDASVNAYKTATNWVTFANHIYPLSSRP